MILILVIFIKWIKPYLKAKKKQIKLKKHTKVSLA